MKQPQGSPMRYFEMVPTAVEGPDCTAKRVLETYIRQKRPAEHTLRVHKIAHAMNSGVVLTLKHKSFLTTDFSF